METYYATICIFIVAFGTIWYLLWNHKKVDEFEHQFWASIKDWLVLARENYRADLARSKEMVRRWLQKTRRRN